MMRTLSAVGASLVLLAGPVAAQTKLSYGTYLPSTHVNNVAGIEPFAKRIEQETGGKVKIEILSGGAVAKAGAAIDSIRDGVVTASMIVDSYVQKQVPNAFTATDLGIIGKNSVALAGATNEYNLVACAECVAEQKKLGIISMAFYSTAPYTMMCKPDLRSMADINGKKIRSASSFSIMFKSFGGVPVNTAPGRGLRGDAARCRRLRGRRRLLAARLLALGRRQVYRRQAARPVQQRFDHGDDQPRGVARAEAGRAQSLSWTISPT